MSTRQDDVEETEEDEQEAEETLQEYKERMDREEIEAYNARADELAALRARIRSVAAEKNVTEAERWVAPSRAEAEEPKMTKFMQMIMDITEPGDANFEPYDPLEEFPFWRQVIEEAKMVKYPSIAKTARLSIISLVALAVTYVVRPGLFVLAGWCVVP